MGYIIINTMKQLLKEILSELKKQNEFTKDYYKKWEIECKRAEDINKQAFKMNKISFDDHCKTLKTPPEFIGGLERFNIK